VSDPNPVDAEKLMVQIAVRDGVVLADQLTRDPRTPMMSGITLAHATALTYGMIVEILGREQADKWLGVVLDGLSNTLDKLGHPIIAGFTRIPSPDGKEPEPPKCGNPDCEACHPKNADAENGGEG
jgi:hypothetical protein